MPKIVEYPLAPFEKVLRLAETVDYLGGSCTIQDCASSMKKKVTGGFGILISSAIKHDLVIRRRDRLLISELYNRIKLAYNNSEKVDNQRISFFHPALYKKIWDRFHDKELPVSMLPKLLIREFQVEADVSEKIAGFFMEGVKQLDLLKDGKLGGSGSPQEYGPVQVPDAKLKIAVPPIPDMQVRIPFMEPEKRDEGETLQNSLPEQKVIPVVAQQDHFIVTVKGKGLESSIIVQDQDDLTIVEALLSKIRKTL